MQHKCFLHNFCFQRLGWLAANCLPWKVVAEGLKLDYWCEKDAAVSMGEPSFPMFRERIGLDIGPAFTFDQRVAFGHFLLGTGNGDFPINLSDFIELVAGIINGEPAW